MNRRPWINKYGTVAVLLMLLLVLNPELRAFLLVTNFIGIDLMIFFISLQLRELLPAIGLFPHQTCTFLCVASFTTLRAAMRIIALVLAPSLITVGLPTWLFVLSRNMWCPRLDQGIREL